MFDKDRMKIINYQGKHIVFLDFSTLSGVEYMKKIEESVSFIKTLTGKESTLLINVTDSSISNAILAAYSAQHRWLDRRAIRINQHSFRLPH